MTDRSASAPYTDFALPHYRQRDSAHDADHIRRILGRLDQLSRGVEPAPRPWMLHFLASFHGLGTRIETDGDFREQVETLLMTLDWTASEIAEGFSLLARHCVDPQTSEERIVHDANYLEVLGAFGIAKAFTKGGADGQSYEQTMAIFEANLARVDFRTPYGRARAADGRAYATAFLDQLRRELAT